MLRVYIKNQLSAILDSILKIHVQGLHTCQDHSQLEGLCSDCQQAAIMVGEAIEKAEINGTDIVSLLEIYCESVYSLLQDSSEMDEKIIDLNEIIMNVKSKIEALPAGYQIVFFPYKASMWDSLESIWKACKEDENGECLVIPIPYYRADMEKKEWIYCYEGDQFPDYVPVIDYKDYDMTHERPDVAFIHNPYDNYNYVTSVDPSYYSFELKKYVQILIYVPYYVTTGHMSDEHLRLSVYQNMDYMIIQSEYLKESFRGLPYYDKLLPFGSPKFDRVIQMSQNKCDIPEEWKTDIGSKKTLMLNTSISCLLGEGTIYLEKLSHLFHWMQGRDEVELIWRPHPLLLSTIQAMRPNLMEQYKEIMDFFITNKIGILDQTPTIEKTVAFADAYIGESASSVISLFGVAGKPIYVLDNDILDHFESEEQKRIAINDIGIFNDELYFTAVNYSALFYMKLGSEEIHMVSCPETLPKWINVYSVMLQMGEKLYLAPNMVSKLASFDLKDKQFIHLDHPVTDYPCKSQNMITYRNKVYYISEADHWIGEYNVADTELRKLDCLKDLQTGIPELPSEVIYSSALSGDDWWIASNYTNRILCIHLLSGTHEIFQAGKDGNAYTELIIDKDVIWLAEVHTGSLIKWNTKLSETIEVKMPDGFRTWNNITGNMCPHRCLFDMGQEIITVPGYSNYMIKINKETGDASVFLSELFDRTDQIHNGYNKGRLMSCNFGKVIDTKVWVQRTYDNALIKIDVDKEICHISYPSLSENDFKRIKKEKTGFEKTQMDHGFFCKESRIFPLDEFVKNLAEGRLEPVKERQKEELATLAANLDGTCGEKVYDFTMKLLNEKNKDERR